MERLSALPPWAAWVVLILHLGCDSAQEPVETRPRILVSTDIGGTDPDDNQSMIHLLMYADRVQIEGLISSPSYGDGNKDQILKAIDLYEKDLPALRAGQGIFPSGDALRAVTKQGRHGRAPYKGYEVSTEGSEWIVECAMRESDRPLWILVWGGLEDIAQALHDAPEIQDRIRVYWIGGPNKKWSANSYAYIAANFPDLWFLEVNSSYYGFFSKHVAEELLTNDNYYDAYISGRGQLGRDFSKHYDGRIKMGDTPSLLYILDGDPNDPGGQSWGGSFERMNRSSRIVFERNTTLRDTVTVCSILEFRLRGPEIELSSDSSCFTMTVQAGIGEQKWDGYYMGEGEYAIRYIPKQSETLSYTISSSIPGFLPQSGEFVVDNLWPGAPRPTDYPVGTHWFTDRSDPQLFDGNRQGAQTVLKYRNEALLDWAKRWERLAPAD